MVAVHVDSLLGALPLVFLRLIHAEVLVFQPVPRLPLQPHHVQRVGRLLARALPGGPRDLF